MVVMGGCNPNPGEAAIQLRWRPGLAELALERLIRPSGLGGPPSNWTLRSTGKWQNGRVKFWGRWGNRAPQDQSNL